MVFCGIAILGIPFAEGLSILQNVTVIHLSQTILRTFQKFNPRKLRMTASDFTRNLRICFPCLISFKSTLIISEVSEMFLAFLDEKLPHKNMTSRSCYLIRYIRQNMWGNYFTNRSHFFSC